MEITIKKIDSVRDAIVQLLGSFKEEVIDGVKLALLPEISKLELKRENLDETISRKEAARLLNCSLTTLCQYQKDGIIPFYKIGKKVLFKKNEILNSNRIQSKKIK